MAMRWAGRDVSIDQLAGQVFTPGRNGSLPVDMTSAARRNGFLAVPISGMPALLDEVAAGHPVIVFENVGFSFFPQWHYAVVHGYDLRSRDVLIHSGHEENRRWDMRRFETAWRGGDYWGLVVLNPGELSAAADELTHAGAAAALEDLGKVDEAEASYRAILERWPESLGAHLGLANIFYSRGDTLGAVWILRDAVRLHPASAVAWHNLAIAEKTVSRKNARNSALKALALAPAEQQLQYRENLKDFVTTAQAPTDSL